VDSSLAESAAELLLASVCAERANHTFGVTALFLWKIGFLSHHFGSSYARKPTKGSKDLECCLDPNTA